MPKESSDTVRLFSLDREAVVGWLRGWARELGSRRLDVRRVLLFGSLARGDHRARSDADVLVELEASVHPRWFDRIPDLLPSGAPVPVDVFPYTVEEVRRMVASGNPLLRRAVSEGIVLFER